MHHLHFSVASCSDETRLPRHCVIDGMMAKASEIDVGMSSCCQLHNGGSWHGTAPRRSLRDGSVRLHGERQGVERDASHDTRLPSSVAHQPSPLLCNITILSVPMRVCTRSLGRKHEALGGTRLAMLQRQPATHLQREGPSWPTRSQSV